MPVDSHIIRDYQGNILTVRSFGEAGRAELTDPLTPYAIQPTGMSGFGDPIFSDEFKNDTLNTSKWEPYYPDTDFWNATTPGGHLTNTNEPQGYDLSGITFDEDGMVFTFREEETVPELAYTSGMVTSYPSFNQTYGYFEARMLLANADDSWPAFWLDRTDQVWPQEWDIMESDGKTSFNLQTYHSFHYPRPVPGGNTSSVHGYTEDVGNNWHTYGGLWEPTRLRWYVDGTLVKDLTIEPEYMDDPMYMILNLAGKKESTPVSPFSIKISHVRVWDLP